MGISAQLKARFPHEMVGKVAGFITPRLKTRPTRLHYGMLGIAQCMSARHTGPIPARREDIRQLPFLRAGGPNVSAILGGPVMVLLCGSLSVEGALSVEAHSLITPRVLPPLGATPSNTRR
jgi:hypothetical protein